MLLCFTKLWISTALAFDHLSILFRVPRRREPFCSWHANFKSAPYSDGIAECDRPIAVHIRKQRRFKLTLPNRILSTFKICSVEQKCHRVESFYTDYSELCLQLHTLYLRVTLPDYYTALQNTFTPSFPFQSTSTLGAGFFRLYIGTFLRTNCYTFSVSMSWYLERCLCRYDVFWCTGSLHRDKIFCRRQPHQLSASLSKWQCGIYAYCYCIWITNIGMRNSCTPANNSSF